MKTYLNFWLLIFVLGITFSSCQKDNESPDLNDQITSGEVTDGHQHSRACGKDAHMETLLANPEYRRAHEEKITRLNKEITYVENRSGCTDPKIIPVAIHFQNINNASIACLRTLAQSQVDILNQDFGGTNSDISIWNNTAAQYFPGVENGEACVKFCIADKNHPVGFGISNGDLAVTLNKTNGDNNSQWSGYLNVFVRANTGLLGYSPLGGNGNGDGVVIDAAAFGAGNGCGPVSPGAPFNLGRTLTHELGHYLLLDHIWGDGCNQDDEVADTPNQSGDNNGCPAFSTTSCGSRDMHMNYMDYTNDACMYMFSAGQIDRVEAYVNTSLSNLTNNAVNKCSEATAGGGTGGGGNNSNLCEAATITSSTTDITTVQARVNWNAIPDAVSYKIRYRKQGTTSWTEFATTQPSRLITGLTAASTYQYQIRTQCPIGLTPYNSSMTFITQAGGSNEPCVKPSTSNVTNITTTSAKVSWNEVPDAIQYRVRYKKVGTATWTGSNTNNTSITLNNFAAGTTYQYQLRTRCASGWTAFTGSQNFTTTSGGTNGCNGAEITVKVVLDYYGSETSWEIVDDNYFVVASDGPYADNQEGSVKMKEVCLPDGCYTLYLDDAYGDGICCDYGNGSLQVSKDGQVVGSSDGYFGYYDVIDLCVQGGAAFITDQRNDSKAAKPIKTMSE